MPEQDDVQGGLKTELKVLIKQSHQCEEVEGMSPDSAGVAEEQNKEIETNKNTKDATNCKDNPTSSMESCSIVNTGSEVINESLQETPQRATTLELDDVQRMQHENKILCHQKISKRTNTNQSSFDKTTEVDQNKNNDEKQTLEAELQKCIEDLKNLKIPSTFLKKQRHWQNELLKKYDM
ncbi:BTB/POZ domain-containing protein KCTD8-like [Hypanus sabinus]|uniref:BTB/POZ domain-containing protein KCTD8-like n=1 Tax=Hypanus sabinus TaxID=79690 RepID=UPI0028C4AA7A|nr:BTB/POZ domain-containing protein KCTD8-like [Hypanus sabinus]